MLNNEKLEDQAMLIISNAGAGRGCAFEALAAAKKGNFEEARMKMEHANQYGDNAHAAHSQLLKMDSRGEVEGVDLLLSHAQDHVMTAQLAIELIAEIIALREDFGK
ncbi:MAG TPA: PTS lactose/cellobiose transporter subunit IIA [Clostridiales bacterium]|nr:PTS lactose/cellobiose transporter subunit IIA [Clostridiales bacterium]